MKNIKTLLFLVVLFCLFPILRINALEVNQTGYINKDGVLYYSEPNYGGNKVLYTLDTGDEIKLLDTNLVPSNDTSRCKSGFYKISYYWESYNKKTYTGYTCSDYINFNIDTGSYADEFANAGLPEIYWEKLALLKSIHPNWKFTSYNTGLDWNEATKAESLVGISYIQSNNPIYLSLDEGSYDSSNGSYIQKEAGGWYAANQATVAYYMDPRNFLDGINVFMFENLGYNSNYQTKDVLNGIFKDTDLVQYIDYYIEAATYDGNNVSPVSLAARSRQEVVVSNGKLSDSANGSTFKDTVVYNFYNIGAFSSCDIDGETVANPVRCGLRYAYNRGWTTPDKAIKEGAKFLAEGYINRGQNTLYLQRWNVTNNNTYSHQYMTNVSAPYSEGRSTYDAYSKINGLLDSEIEFIIPVYNNMPLETSKLPTTVDNNKINEITTNSNIGNIITNSGYTNRDEYITGIKVGTKASNVINNIRNNGGSVSINQNGQDISGSEILATNDILTVKSNNESKTYRIVIVGDANGDGKITAVDYVKVKNHIMNSSTLDGIYKIAADANNDGKVSAVDYVNIKNYIMGSSSTLR